jgi:primosomal replication protein N
MLGAATMYALDERKKRKEEEAQQAAQVQAEVDARNAAHQASLQAKIAAREALKIQGWLEAQALPLVCWQE